jgi:hypothetical protein
MADGRSLDVKIPAGLESGNTSSEKQGGASPSGGHTRRRDAGSPHQTARKRTAGRATIFTCIADLASSGRGGRQDRCGHAHRPRDGQNSRRLQ